MQKVETNGISVSYPDSISIKIVEPANSITPPLDTPGFRTFDSDASSVETFSSAPLPSDAWLIETLSDQSIRLVSEFHLQAPLQSDAAAAGPPVRALDDEGEKRLEMEIEVDLNESAALLLEHNGLLQWAFSEDIENLTPPPTAPSNGRPETRDALDSTASIAPSKQKLTFRLPLSESGETAEALPEGPARRLLLPETLIEPLRVLVFRFVARLAVGPVMHYLESRFRRGMVHIQGRIPMEWGPLGGENRPVFPKDRPARILLFVHGTFSSTAGSFGALGATPWGQTFLSTVEAAYDAVLGFDHPTLSVDPLVNATDLLQELRSLFPVGQALPPRMDVICYSRGGLVVRCLLEQLLPADDWTAEWGRVVFVAGANAGTLLGKPANWKAFADTYTNLVVQGCATLSLFPEAAPAVGALKEVVAGLGAFVKALATTVLEEKRVPGLAAMDPEGEFILTLNAAQPGNPGLDRTNFYTITSEFATDAPGEGEDLTAIEQILDRVKEQFLRQLMGEGNDLVVNTTSMKAIEVYAGSMEASPYIKDSFDFGKTRRVFHTIYFTRPEVTRALSLWLRLSEAPVLEGSDFMTPIPAIRSLPSPALRVSSAGGFAQPELPAVVETHLFTDSVETTVNEIQSRLQKISESDSPPVAIVLKRLYRGEWLFYALRASEILSLPSDDQSLLEALQLHEESASRPVRSASRIRALAIEQRDASPTSDIGARTPARGVVLERDTPVGVVLEAVPATTRELAAMTAPTAIEESWVTLGPDNTTDGGGGLAGNDIDFNGPNTRNIDLDTPLKSIPPDRPDASPQPVKTTCHIRAEMPEVIPVGTPSMILVRIARELLVPLLPSSKADEGEFAIEEDKNIVLQIVPIRNVEVVNAEQLDVLPPQPGRPFQGVFTVQGTDAGEGEVRILALQNGVRLCTLVLYPEVTVPENAAAGQGNESRRASAPQTVEERVSPAKPLKDPLYQLFVFERQNGQETSFEYLLQAPVLANGLGVVRRYSSKPLGQQRDAFVQAIYKNIEERWNYSQSANTAFRAELKAIGMDLFRRMFPSGLQSLLWKNKDTIQGIMVISYEPFIPWEIVHLREPQEEGEVPTPPPAESYFLGEMGLVRWLDGMLPPETLRVRPGKAMSLAPVYAVQPLASAQKEPQMVADLFDGVGAEPHKAPTEPNELRDLLSTPGAFDLFHFAGHGLANSAEIMQAALILQVVKKPDGKPGYVALNATTVQEYARLLGSEAIRPMVVLNACQLGREGYALGQLGGFASAFIGAGAGLFVGALWSVIDTTATVFTQALYEHLLADDTLAKATAAARKKAGHPGSDEYAACSHLAYSVYGHPNATLSR